MAKKKVTEEDGTIEEVDVPDEPIKGKHIFVEGGDGSMLMREAPADYNGEAPARQLTLDGRNFEHVSEHASGIWCYRQM